MSTNDPREKHPDNFIYSAAPSPAEPGGYDAGYRAGIEAAANALHERARIWRNEHNIISSVTALNLEDEIRTLPAAQVPEYDVTDALDWTRLAQEDRRALNPEHQWAFDRLAAQGPAQSEGEQPKPGTCFHPAHFFDIETYTCLKCDLAALRASAGRK